MLDLSTTYLGMRLENPLVASASPISRSLEGIKQLADSGAAAIVLYSLFEEQITGESHELDRALTRGAESYAEALSYFPEADEYRLGPDQYVEHVHRAKRAVHVPIIGSLNGISAGGWLRYAKAIQDAGADALELNIYNLPTDPEVTSQEIEDGYVDLVRAVRETITIPIAVKLSPFFTNFGALARRLDRAGANALVLFNRFYQPDFDLDALEVTHHADLSQPDHPHTMRLALRWIAILAGRIVADLAATGGVHSGLDSIKLLMAGANVTMMTSELLQRGPRRLAAILDEIAMWMEEHEYDSVEQLQGSMSQRSVAFPSAFERAHYIRILSEYELAPR